MTISLGINFITGIMFGFEHYHDSEDEVHYLIVDILFIRFLIGIGE